jgi:hypothetical protein
MDKPGVNSCHKVISNFILQALFSRQQVIVKSISKKFFEVQLDEMPTAGYSREVATIDLVEPAQLIQAQLFF